MTSFAELLQQGTTHAWLFIPSAILLGALHGLEPGHSKTMMAAFIVAVRGTVAQAVLLGLSATVSHTAVVWVIALVGLHYGSQIYSEATEGYFQIASAGLIIVIALWMLLRTYREQQREKAHGAHDHHGHDHHDHDHGDPAQDHSHVHDHEHSHNHAGLDVAAAGFQDAHERAHADDIKRRFANRHITTGQIVMFGLTGGLIPCPASITILLLCLQLKQYSLGLTLVLCFSIGLALTMVATGAVAALSVREASRRFTGFGTLARRAPYVSGLLIIGIGLYTGCLGWAALAA
jgi:ABC-type nickel/cobalt efflux system permease component RcnA